MMSPDRVGMLQWSVLLAVVRTGDQWTDMADVIERLRPGMRPSQAVKVTRSLVARGMLRSDHMDCMVTRDCRVCITDLGRAARRDRRAQAATPVTRAMAHRG